MDYTNVDGTITITSETNPSLTQTLAASTTGIQLAAAIQALFPLAEQKATKQAQLDNLFDSNFDLAKFIRAGSSTVITAANVGTFLATITNNYRSLRASIAAAPDATTLAAINVLAGWPANP